MLPTGFLKQEDSFPADVGEALRRFKAYLYTVPEALESDMICDSLIYLHAISEIEHNTYTFLRQVYGRGVGHLSKILKDGTIEYAFFNEEHQKRIDRFRIEELWQLTVQAFTCDPFLREKGVFDEDSLLYYFDMLSFHPLFRQHRPCEVLHGDLRAVYNRRVYTLSPVQKTADGIDYSLIYSPLKAALRPFNDFELSEKTISTGMDARWKANARAHFFGYHEGTKRGYLVIDNRTGAVSDETDTEFLKQSYRYITKNGQIFDAEDERVVCSIDKNTLYYDAGYCLLTFNTSLEKEMSKPKLIAPNGEELNAPIRLISDLAWHLLIAHLIRPSRKRFVHVRKLLAAQNVNMRPERFTAINISKMLEELADRGIIDRTAGTLVSDMLCCVGKTGYKHPNFWDPSRLILTIAAIALHIANEPAELYSSSMTKRLVDMISAYTDTNDDLIKVLTADPKKIAEYSGIILNDHIPTQAGGYIITAEMIDSSSEEDPRADELNCMKNEIEMLIKELEEIHES